MARAKTSKSGKPVRDAEKTRLVILSAAAQEFSQHGFTAARTEAIAAKTGVAKSMIYYYFGDKEGLYKAVLARSHDTLWQAVQKIDLEALSPEVAIERFLKALLDCVSKDPQLPTIMVNEAMLNQGKYYPQSSSSSIDAVLIEILEKGVEAGVFRQLDPLQTAINIMGVCLFYFIGAGNIQQLLKNKKVLSKSMLEQHTQEAISLVLHGLLARNS